MTPPAPLMTETARRWRFGAVELDERTRALSVGGQIVEIEPKPMRLLQHLLENAGQVVTKDALMRAVWPGRIIGEATLAKAVGRLRDALADREQALIKTHHGYGYRLGVPVQVEQLAPEYSGRPISSAERRVLTVLFCDMVGSTDLADALDPELFRELLIEYQTNVAEICRRYEGHVAQRLGDGMMLYFGYPAAHDDDAERAVRCGCDLLRRLKSLERANAVISLRVGVHTGPVVIGEMGDSNEVLATGPSVHLAARLQSLAPADSLLISDATFRLVPGLFVTQDFGPQSIRGLSEEVRVHQVLQPSGVRSRLEAAAALTPFVGREREIGLIEAGWKRALDGYGQGMLIRGDPGLGKSRLLLEMRTRLSGSAYTWLECRAAALARNSAYLPLVDLMTRGLGLRDDDSGEEKLRRLERALESLGLEPGETIPFVGPLLNLAPADRYPVPQLGAELKRRRTLEALTRWILRLAQRQPMVVVFEDLHWADESSIACMGTLLKELVDMPVLLLMTARPEFAPPWDNSQANMDLDPLPAEEAGRLLGYLTSDSALARSLWQLIIQRAAGVPLFVEELTRALLESGELVERDGELQTATPTQQLTIPFSLQGLLMARLDRLGAARDVIQIAAAIGRECPLRLLQQVSDIEPSALQRHLGHLCESGLLYARNDGAETYYVIKHALIQDAAYETLLRGRRQTLHSRIADALEQVLPERMASEPEIFAMHFEKADRIRDALKFYVKATKRLAATGSYSEAIGHAEHALALLPRLHDPSERHHCELDLLVGLGESKMAIMGRGNPALDPILARCNELLPLVNDGELEACALGNLSLTLLGSAQYEGGIEAATRLLDLADRKQSRTYKGAGHALIAMNCFWIGDLSGFEMQSQQALLVFDERSSYAATRLVGQDGISAARGLGSMVLWLLGYPDRSLRLLDQNLSRAQASQQMRSISLEYVRQSYCYLVRGEPERAIEMSRVAAELGERHGLDEMRDAALMFLGIAQAMGGDWKTGYALSRRMIALRQSRRMRYGEAGAFGHIADVSVAAGRLEEADEALAQADAAEAQFGTHLFESDLHRIRGDLLLARGGTSTLPAESCFQTAIAVARRQGAKCLELRAALALARVWRSQARIEEALSLLRPIFDWFTEGHSIPDLVQARSMLDLLDQSRRIGEH